MSTSDQHRTPQTCDRCHQALSAREIELGWPVSVDVPGSHGQDHQYICASCYGDEGVCTQCGEVISAYVGGTCPCTHTYDVTWTDGSGVTETIDASSLDEAIETARDMAEAGEWGDDGAIITGTVRQYDADGDEIDSRDITVTIDADESALIRAVAHDGYELIGCGTDPDDHDWTSAGEGGCTDNPGVWSLGGTTIHTSEHCTRCGLERLRTMYGTQRDPGQVDRIVYQWPMGGEA